jgi:hypothetical protein
MVSWERLLTTISIQLVVPWQRETVRLGALCPGGRRVVEFVAAWDMLSAHLRPIGLTSGAPAEVILDALKLVLPRLQVPHPPFSSGPRWLECTVAAIQDSRLSTFTPLLGSLPGGWGVMARKQAKGAEAQRHALAVAAILADVGMDQDTIAVGLLDGAVGEGLLSLAEVAPVMGMQVGAASLQIFVVMCAGLHASHHTLHTNPLTSLGAGLCASGPARGRCCSCFTTPHVCATSPNGWMCTTTTVRSTCGGSAWRFMTSEQ